MSKYLAVDFGAESGRVILGTLNGRKIDLKEIHRFPNRQIQRSGHTHWDIMYLFDELKNGIAAVVKQGHNDISSIGVDTWGVDFGLLGKDDRLLDMPYTYRDSRTDGMMEKAFELMPRNEIYSYTGSQFIQLNSIYQLFSMVVNNEPNLEKCETMLLLADLFNFFLTGEKKSEYTIASTSQLLNAKNRKWESKIFDKLGIPEKIVTDIIPPGSIIGSLSQKLKKEVGLSAIDVVAPACHDTASAVATVPAQSENWAFISSGTWSLLGVELRKPIITEESLQNNFTNEGGVGGTIRFLRNVTGLWLLQRCKKDWETKGESNSYAELVKIAEDAKPFRAIVNPDDAGFLNPVDMPAKIVDFCEKTGQNSPITKGEFVRTILESLALRYRFIIEKVNNMIPEPVEAIHIVGGGSQNELLNQYTANATGVPVVAGPVEATAIGNIIMQAIGKNEIGSIKEGREVVRNSFPLKTYQPFESEKWTEVYERVKSFF